MNLMLGLERFSRIGEHLLPMTEILETFVSEIILIDLIILEFSLNWDI